MKKMYLRNILFVYDIVLVLLVIFVLVKTRSVDIASGITSLFITLTTACGLITLLFYSRHYYERHIKKRA